MKFSSRANGRVVYIYIIYRECFLVDLIFLPLNFGYGGYNMPHMFFFFPVKKIFILSHGALFFPCSSVRCVEKYSIFSDDAYGGTLGILWSLDHVQELLELIWISWQFGFDRSPILLLKPPSQIKPSSRGKGKIFKYGETICNESRTKWQFRCISVFKIRIATASCCGEKITFPESLVMLFGSNFFKYLEAYKMATVSCMDFAHQTSLMNIFIPCLLITKHDEIFLF